MAGTGIDASIPLGIKPVDPMATLGSMANVANAMTQVKRSNVQLEQETGALDARRSIARVMSDPALRDPDTGLPDLNRLWPALQEADPKGYLRDEVFGKVAGVNNDLAKVKSIGMTLGDQAQAYVGQRMGALSLDPNVTPKDVYATLDDMVRVAPGSKPISDIIRRTVDTMGEKHPQALGPVLTKFRNFAFPVASQAPQTGQVQTGAATVPVQTNQLAGPVGPIPGAQPIPNAVGPAGAETQKMDALGNPYVETRAADGRIGTKPLPGATMPPLLAFPPGESPQTAAALAQTRQSTNAAALTVPEQRFNNAQIIKLADGAITGANADALNKVLTSVGIQPMSGSTGDDYNKLGHFIALQAQKNAQAMGAGTDASRGLAEQATASRQWTPQAIKDATRVNDALATGVEQFNQGLERAINDPANQKSIFAARDFQNAWAQSFDVNAMRLYNAVKAGDSAELSHIIRELGGKDSARAKEVAQKARALERLVNEGRP